MVRRLRNARTILCADTEDISQRRRPGPQRGHRPLMRLQPRHRLECALYLDVMQHFVELFQEDGFVTGSAPITEICAPIGIMRRQMTIWMNSYPRAANSYAGAGGWR